MILPRLVPLILPCLVPSILLCLAKLGHITSSSRGTKMACTLIQYRKIHRAFFLVLIEDRGPHVDLFLKHQVLICLARCLGLFQVLASTIVSTHCHCNILLLASKLRISAHKKILRKFGTSMVCISIYAISLGLCKATFGV